MAGEGDRVGHTLITSSQQVLLSLFLSGPNRGHYITIVKSHGYWLLFDDDVVEVNHCGNPISTWSSTTAPVIMFPCRRLSHTQLRASLVRLMPSHLSPTSLDTSSSTSPENRDSSSLSPTQTPISTFYRSELEFITCPDLPISCINVIPNLHKTCLVLQARPFPFHSTNVSMPILTAISAVKQKGSD